MHRLTVALAVIGLLGATGSVAPVAASSGWQAAVPFTNQVASVPFVGGG